MSFEAVSLTGQQNVTSASEEQVSSVSSGVEELKVGRGGGWRRGGTEELLGKGEDGMNALGRNAMGRQKTGGRSGIYMCLNPICLLLPFSHLCIYPCISPL